MNLRKPFDNIRHNRFTYKGLEPRLDYIFFEITHRCNLNCQMCWFGDGVLNKNEKPELNYDEIISFIDTLKDVKYMTITGGEPLLKPRILDIMHHVEKKGIKVSLATNGTVFSKKLYDSILAMKNINMLNISLDGPKEIHNMIRRKDYAYDQTIQAINYVVKNKPDNFPMQVNFTISALNYKYIMETYNLLCSLNVPQVQYIHLSYNTTNENNYTDFKQADSLRDIDLKVLSKELDCLFYENIFSKNINVKIIPHVGSDEIIKYYTNPDYVLANKCGPLSSGLKVNAFGEIFPCRNIEKPMLGNVKDINVNDVFNSQEIVSFRKNMNGKLQQICNKCCAVRR